MGTVGSAMKGMSATAAPATSSAGLDTEEPFPADLKEPFLARSNALHVRRGQIILSEGSTSDDVYLIVSGKVQISLFSVHGRETILRVMGPGMLFGELAALDAQPRSANVAALEDTILAHLNGAAFRDFLSEVPVAGFWMAQQLAARVRNLTEKTFELANLSVSSRIQSELLRIAREVSGDGETAIIAEFPTHAELAARVGTHREAVTRELGLLAKEDIVSQSGRTLHILSLASLQNILARTQG